MQQEILNKKSDGYKSHAEGITRIPDRVRWFDSETFKLISPFFDEVELYYILSQSFDLEGNKRDSALSIIILSNHKNGIRI